MIRRTKRFVLVSLITVAYTLMSATLAFAGGDPEEPPATQIRTSGTQYISPNADGIQESAEISFEVTIFVKSDEGYIPEYGIQVLDSAGNAVQEIVERQESDLGWLARIFRRYEAFTLEKSMVWDGTDLDGELVDDGEYTLEMWVIDPQEQREDINLASFVVDTTPPEVEISIQEPAIFSPNGDGNLETFTITQTGGTDEDLWSGEIVDVDGNVVVAYEWTNGAPETIVWNGMSDSSEFASDGAHRFRIAATDRGGNSFSAETGEFQLVTIETPLYITLDEEYISPNGDGIQDVITATISQDVSDD